MTAIHLLPHHYFSICESQSAVPIQHAGRMWRLRSLTAAVFAGVALILVIGVSIELVHALRARSATKA
jgi:hypothetical protein